MRFTALPPPPPTPITLILAPWRTSSEKSTRKSPFVGSNSITAPFRDRWEGSRLQAAARAGGGCQKRRVDLSFRGAGSEEAFRPGSIAWPRIVHLAQNDVSTALSRHLLWQRRAY